MGKFKILASGREFDTMEELVLHCEGSEICMDHVIVEHDKKITLQETVNDMLTRLTPLCSRVDADDILEFLEDSIDTPPPPTERQTSRLERSVEATICGGVTIKWERVLKRHGL